MYKQCTTEQSAARQRLLLEGLLEAMNRQHYEEITVSSLCDQMRIPRKSFYRYFSSKEGALHAMIDQTLLDFDGYALNFNSQNSTLRQKLELLFLYWQDKKPLLDALQRSGLSGMVMQRAIGLGAFQSLREQKQLSEQERQAREYTLLFVVSGFMSMVIRWHHDGYPRTAQEMADITLRLIKSNLASYVHL